MLDAGDPAAVLAERQRRLAEHFGGGDDDARSVPGQEELLASITYSTDCAFLTEDGPSRARAMRSNGTIDAREVTDH